MEIVVRTPHGDADVSIVSHAPPTTLADIVAAVTGQAVPRLVQVDGRLLDAATVLGDAELTIGSVLTSDPPTPAETADSDMALVQVTGHGAGRITRLGPGRYRIGPGRRSSADELAVAPVDRTMFELVVEHTESVPAVAIAADAPDVAVDGRPLTEQRRWIDETLTVGPRAFELEAPASTRPARKLPTPAHDGTVAFSRPPRRPAAAPRRPVVDAVVDAAAAATSLWERRPGDADAFAIPIGLHDHDHDHDHDHEGSVATLDLNAERAVAITGSERFRSGLVRTVVVEAVTLHGPADLDVVVLTRPDRLGSWDWAKWLPHLRLDGPPAIWSSRTDIERWAEGVEARSDATRAPGRSTHLTVAIIDGPELWNRRDAPLRSVLTSPPADLRLIALCDDAARAPAACTLVVSEVDRDRASVQSFTRSADARELRPALIETPVAADVARSIAPLDDVELPTSTPSATTGDEPVELGELLGVADVDDVLARWSDGTDRPAVAIGRRGTDLVDVPIVDDVLVVTGPSIGDAFDVAATWLLGQAVDRPPGQLWIAPTPPADSPRSEWIWQLPHSTERHDPDSTVDASRLIARLRAVLADPAGPARIVVVTEAADVSPATADTDWLRAMADGVHSTDGLAMVVVTDRPDVTAAIGDTVVTVEEASGNDGSGMIRSATVSTREGELCARFLPVQRSTSSTATLVLAPFVVGRAMTPLERRVEQQRALMTGTPDAALDGIAALLRAAATGQYRIASAPTERRVVPPPLPGNVELDELFESAPGDGVPLGLVDEPATGAAQVHWWEPGQGSLLVFGSRRSGMDQVVTTILLGAIDRFADLDVRLIVVEPSPARRRVLARIDRSIQIVAPDQHTDVDSALAEIDAGLAGADDSNSAGRPAAPRLVVLINDLVHLRRQHAGQPLGSHIDDVLVRAAAPGSGVDLVASAAELDRAGPFATAASRRLVGASSDHGELAVLGIERPSELDMAPGRCRSFPADELVQLATISAEVETVLARRANGGSP